MIRNPNQFYPINLFRLFYGILTFVYLLGLIILYTTSYPHLMKSSGVIFHSTYGVMLSWNLSKIFLLSLILFCCLCGNSSLPLWVVLSFAAIAGAVLLGSLSFMLLLITDTLFVANGENTHPNHPANSPLYCCVYYDTNKHCNINQGPCINVNLTQHNINPSMVGYHGNNNNDDMIPYITKEHLTIDYIFQITVYMIVILFCIELFIMWGFVLILKSLNSGKGLFYDIPIKYRRKDDPDDFDELSDRKTTKYINTNNRHRTITKKTSQRKSTTTEQEEEEEEEDIPSSNNQARVRSRFKHPDNVKSSLPYHVKTGENGEKHYYFHSTILDRLKQKIYHFYVRSAGWAKRKWVDVKCYIKINFIHQLQQYHQQQQQQKKSNNTKNNTNNGGDRKGNSFVSESTTPLQSPINYKIDSDSDTLTYYV